jgi:type IV secretion system protein VirB1
MLDFFSLAQECAPGVHPQTMAAVARVESGFNPYAIGVVGGRLVRQPVARDEAVATARSLEAQGFNFSLGVGQVNRHNLARYGLDYASAFDACANLRAGAAILTECYARASKSRPDSQAALRAAFSCYYSGNFETGFREGYVAKVIGDAPGSSAAPIAVVRTGRTRPVASRSTRANSASPPELPASPSALLF